jgi:hypothetical protein
MTAQMQEDYSTQIAVEELIEELKSLTHKGDCVDGETMQYILQKVGMEDQMLWQLMHSCDRLEVERIWDDIVHLRNRTD